MKTISGPIRKRLKRLYSHIAYVEAAVGLFKMVLYTTLSNFRAHVISGLEFLCAGGLGAPSGHILIDSRILTSTQMGNSRYALPIPK